MHEYIYIQNKHMLVFLTSDALVVQTVRQYSMCIGLRLFCS